MNTTRSALFAMLMVLAMHPIDDGLDSLSHCTGGLVGRYDHILSGQSARFHTLQNSKQNREDKGLSNA